MEDGCPPGLQRLRLLLPELTTLSLGAGVLALLSFTRILECLLAGNASTIVLALPASKHSRIRVKLNSASTPAPSESVVSSGRSKRSRCNPGGQPSSTQWPQD